MFGKIKEWARSDKEANQLVKANLTGRLSRMQRIYKAVVGPAISLLIHMGL